MKMADPPSKIKWDKENVRVITFKLFKKNDGDIIEYLSTHDTAKTIRIALREYLENHKNDQ